jgi:predicted DCC family thiol-disulfide oxidoreductase YuxK
MANAAAHLILFDGVCNLCNAAVQFVITHDPKSKFSFCSLQSAQGKAILEQHGLAESYLDSFVYIAHDKVYVRSAAALHVAREMGGFWSLLYGFMIVPTFIRDWFYDLVAKYRYKLFGRRDSCVIPTPELKSRFLG